MASLTRLGWQLPRQARYDGKISQSARIVMDTFTVVIMLAVQLLLSGGLLFLIGRRLPPHNGTVAWALGLCLFGAAYVVRLVFGLNAPWPLTLLSDTAMVAASLHFMVGCRQYLNAPAWPLRTLLALLGAHLLAEAVAIAVWGAVGRHATLNLTLGVIYLRLAWESGSAGRGQPAELARPLRLMALMMGSLGGFTVARSPYVLVFGAQALYTDAVQRAYYVFASVAAILLVLNLQWLVFVKLNWQLGELANRDALTRLLNRTGLEEVLQRHFGQRPPRPLSLLALDLDHFKPINDLHGHATGDAVLRAVADRLQATVRAGDFVARMGGEEFLVGCADADPAAARALAERLRQAVADCTLDAPAGGEPLNVTVSVGVSPPVHTLAAVPGALNDADVALYAAKAAGRNRVVWTA